MNWHTDCYACTCTSDKFQHSSAQLTPWGIAADGRRAGAPSSSRLASNLIPVHHQIDNHSRGGEPRGACCGYRPADGRRACSSVANLWLPSLHDIVSLKLGAGFGRRPFRAEGRGANPRLANKHPLSAELLKNFAKGSKRHFQVSVCLGPEPSLEQKNAVHEKPTSYQGASDDRRGCE